MEEKKKQDKKSTPALTSKHHGPQQRPPSPETLAAVKDVTGEQLQLQSAPQQEAQAAVAPIVQEDEAMLPSETGATVGQASKGMKRDRSPQGHIDIPVLDDEMWMDETTRKRKAQALDDVPISIKRTRYQENPAGINQLPLVVLNATVYPGSKEWFDKYQVGGLGELMNKVIRGVRIHSQPRNKLYDHERHKRFNRLTIMLNEAGQVSVKDDGLERTCEKMEKPWCGLTIFYHDKPTYEEAAGVYYLDTPVGLVNVQLTHEEVTNVKDAYGTWMNDLFELVLKPSQKELESKYFDRSERQKFAASDLAEWRQWVINQAVEVEPASQEA